MFSEHHLKIENALASEDARQWHTTLNKTVQEALDPHQSQPVVEQELQPHCQQRDSAHDCQGK